MVEVEKLSESAKVFEASNINASPFLLEILSRDESREVRLRVAKNTATHWKTLKILANDPDFMVRMRVAANSHTPSNVLRFLAEENDSYLMKLELIRNPNVEADLHRQLLEELASFRKPTVQQAIVNDPTATADTLIKVLEHVSYNNEFVLGMIRRHNNADEKVIQKIKDILFKKLD